MKHLPSLLFLLTTTSFPILSTAFTFLNPQTPHQSITSSSFSRVETNLHSSRFQQAEVRDDGWYPSQFLPLPGGHEIAYDELFLADSQELVLYLPNLADGRSNPTSWNVEKFCERTNRNFIVPDWFGRGDSTGKLMEATISRWTDDTIAILENLARHVKSADSRKAVVVGSGVGGWVAILVALKRPDLVRGIVGLGVDPDFTEDLLWKELDDDVKRTIMSVGFQEVEWGTKGEIYPITRTLIEDGRKNLILRGGPGSLNVKCPVRLIHALNDVEVPPFTSLRLAECLAGDNVLVTMPKFGLGTPYAAIKQCFEMTAVPEATG